MGWSSILDAMQRISLSNSHFWLALAEFWYNSNFHTSWQAFDDHLGYRADFGYADFLEHYSQADFGCSFREEQSPN